MIKLSNGTQPDSLILLAACGNAHQELKDEGTPGLPRDVHITYGRNGKHSEGSQHYTDQALDVRSKTFADRVEKLRFLKRVIGRLGTPVAVGTPTGPGYMTSDREWLGILEHEGTKNEHFHLERN